MLSENTYLKLPILQGTGNFREWLRAVQGAAQLGGFAAPLFNPLKNVVSILTGLTKDAADQREMKARGLITRMISPHIATELESAKLPPLPAPPGSNTTASTTPQDVSSAAEQLEWLRQEYEKIDTVSVIFEWQKLISTHLVDDGTLEAQLDKLWETRARCALHGIKIDDYLFAGTILTQLPESFNMVRDTLLLLKDITALTSSEVHTKILEKEVCST